MTTVIAIATGKGGTGKSSTAINMTFTLIDAGYRVKVLDLDPQASFTKFMRRRRKLGLSDVSVQTVPEGLIADTVEEERASEEDGILLLDTPGNLEAISMAAMRVSDAVISPVKPTGMDLMHSADTALRIRELHLVNPNLRFLLFLNEAVPRWKISRNTPEAVRNMLSSLDRTTVLQASIPHAAAIAEFVLTGQTVKEYAPSSPAAKAYRRLTKEVVQCLES